MKNLLCDLSEQLQTPGTRHTKRAMLYPRIRAPQSNVMWKEAQGCQERTTEYNDFNSVKFQDTLKLRHYE